MAIVAAHNDDAENALHELPGNLNIVLNIRCGMPWSFATIDITNDETILQMFKSDIDFSNYEENDEVEIVVDSESEKELDLLKVALRAKMFTYNPKHDIEFEKGMLFTNVNAFGNALKDYVIQKFFQPNIKVEPRFLRLFISFKAQKDGFLKGCRPFIGFGGCYLKGPYGGTLLTVIALDGNNSLFPLAFVVAECDLRGKPIITLVEGLRRKFMKKMHKSFQKSCTWTSHLTPKIVNKLKLIAEQSRRCELMMASGALFEVVDTDKHYIVNLSKRTCECGEFQISGIPCKHDALGIIYRREKLDDFCDAAFSKTCY
ncbi:hypothetical protein ACH5RR_001509 [Cinchona calisaya]|uniref:SWIM-type domain-containing protein n=1 Tax=Cinchona calisaya TaxID=153742 RepID=A0ABD3B4D9_9GENT